MQKKIEKLLQISHVKQVNARNMVRTKNIVKTTEVVKYNSRLLSLGHPQELLRKYH